MTSAFSWRNSISLCPASFCPPRSNLPVTPGITWLPTFAFQSSRMKRTSFLGVIEGLVGLHRTIQLQLHQHNWSGHRVGLLWYWMVCLGNEQRSFCCFWDCIQVLHLSLPTVEQWEGTKHFLLPLREVYLYNYSSELFVTKYSVTFLPSLWPYSWNSDHSPWNGI